TSRTRARSERGTARGPARRGPPRAARTEWTGTRGPRLQARAESGESCPPGAAPGRCPIHPLRPAGPTTSTPAPLRGRPGSRARWRGSPSPRSEEHTSELQSRENLVCRLLLEKKKNEQKHHSKKKNKKGASPVHRPQHTLHTLR